MASARQDKLRAALAQQTGVSRPLLTSINGDSTWLLSFPLPAGQKQQHKQYYHVLTDPWLKGDTWMLSSWFIHIARGPTAVANDGAGVDDIVKDIEAAATGRQQRSGTGPLLDAIFVNFHYLDHMHQPTLLTFDPRIPVFATKQAYSTISSWAHFQSVFVQGEFEPNTDGGWQSLHPGSSLPEWLTVFHLKGEKELQYATMVVWSHDQAQHEGILLSPHGIKVDQPNLQALFGSACEPPVSTLAIMTTLKRSFTLGMGTTLGVGGGLALERHVKPKYWIPLSDCYLAYGGVMMWLLWVNDVFLTLDDGLKEEAAAGKGESRRPNLVDVKSGDYMILV